MTTLKMVKKLLSEAFSVQDELDLISELVSVKLPIGDETPFVTT